MSCKICVDIVESVNIVHIVYSLDVVDTSDAVKLWILRTWCVQECENCVYRKSSAACERFGKRFAHHPLVCARLFTMVLGVQPHALQDCFCCAPLFRG